MSTPDPTVVTAEIRAARTWIVQLVQNNPKTSIVIALVVGYLSQYVIPAVLSYFFTKFL